MQGNFAAFATRHYQLLWGGTLFSTTAFMTSFLLVPIVAYEITDSYAASGFAQMGSGVSMLLLGPIGGVIADRYAKKPLVLVGQIVPALLILGTGVLVVSGLITIWMLFISSLLMGVGFALMGPARQAWMGELIPRSLMGSGVGLMQVAQNLALVLGPMLGSVLLIAFAFGSGQIYFLIVGFFLVALPLTTWLPNARAKPATERRSIVRELGSGFTYLMGSPRLRILWGYWMVVAVCRFASQTLLPGFIERNFGVPASDTFLLYLVVGVVALAANVPLAGMVSGRRAWQLLIGFGLLMALVFVLGALTPSFFALMLVAILVGISTTGVMLVNQALIMTNSRPEYFGRVMSFVVLGFAAQSLLAPIWGVTADAIGGRETMVLVGMITLAATVLLGVGWLRTRWVPLEAGTPAALAVAAGWASPGRPEGRLAFAARLAPVVRMGGQKVRSSSAPSGD
ncbi:MAG: MFS transporter [Chloroflexota bacterium]|nr:MFS transporter [Chloroflexota bacterium]